MQVVDGPVRLVLGAIIVQRAVLALDPGLEHD